MTKPTTKQKRDNVNGHQGNKSLHHKLPKYK